MASLKAVAEAIGSGACEVAEFGTIAVRIVPMAVSEAIGEAFPRPAPPLKKAVGGSNAPMETDYASPVYAEQMQQRDNRITAATVAWSIATAGMSVEAGPPPRIPSEVRTWAPKAAAEMMDAWPMQVIAIVSRAVVMLGVKVEKEAPKV